MIAADKMPVQERKWNTSLVNDTERRKSELCKSKHLQMEWYKRWCLQCNLFPTKTAIHKQIPIVFYET